MLGRVKKTGKVIAKWAMNQIITRNEDSLYYSRVYIDQNREHVKYHPIVFLITLLKINWFSGKHDFERLQTYAQVTKCKGSFECYVNRPKVFRFAEQFIGYDLMIINPMDCLFVGTKTEQEIYEEVGELLEITGFLQMRQAYSHSGFTIDEIYSLLSKKVGRLIVPDLEVRIYQESILINPYIERALEVVVYNNVPIVAILDTLYPASIYEQILSSYEITFRMLKTTGEEKKGLEDLLSQALSNENRSYKKRIFLTSRYEEMKKLCNKAHGKMIYYRSTSMFADEIFPQHLAIAVSKEEKERMAMHLFSGLRLVNRAYTLFYLEQAPVFYHLLARIHKKEEILHAPVMILCDKESMLQKIYEMYFNHVIPVLWSPLASYEPKSVKEWKRILTEYPRLHKIPVERIMYALGVGSYLEGNDTLDTMIMKLIPMNQQRDKNEIGRYLQEACGKGKAVILWNPLGMGKMMETFLEHFRESKLFEEVYIIDDLNEAERNMIRQMVEKVEEELPVLLGIFGDVYRFALPNQTDKNEIPMYEQVLMDYMQMLQE